MAHHSKIPHLCIYLHISNSFCLFVNGLSTTRFECKTHLFINHEQFLTNKYLLGIKAGIENNNVLTEISNNFSSTQNKY
jgi:hypothetical protein